MDKLASEQVGGASPVIEEGPEQIQVMTERVDTDR